MQIKKISSKIKKRKDREREKFTYATSICTAFKLNYVHITRSSKPPKQEIITKIIITVIIIIKKITFY